MRQNNGTDNRGVWLTNNLFYSYCILGKFVFGEFCQLDYKVPERTEIIKERNWKNQGERAKVLD